MVTIGSWSYWSSSKAIGHGEGLDRGGRCQSDVVDHRKVVAQVVGERHGRHILACSMRPYLVSRPISCTRWTAWPREETPSLR